MGLRLATFFSFAAVAWLFVMTLQYLNETMSPEIVRQKLRDTAALVELNPWDVNFFRCPESRALSESDCVAFETEVTQVTFPARDALAATIAKLSQLIYPGERLVARVSHSLTPAAAEWLGARKQAVLMFPRSIQGKLTFPGREAVTVGYGSGQNAEVPLQWEDVSEGERLHVYFDVTGFAWFGPISDPPALLEPTATLDYGSLSLRRQAASGMLRQLMVGFPLVLASMAFIIDHSLSFLLLSFYGATQALRSFIPVLATQWGGIPAWLDVLYLGACGLSMALLVLFVVGIASRWRPSWRASVAFCLASALSFSSVRILYPQFYLVADGWSDGLAGLLGCLTLCASALRTLVEQWKKRSAPEENGEEESAVQRAQSLFVMRHALVWIRNTALLFGLGVNAWANALDLLRVSGATAKGFLDWKHALLLPVLIAASLVEVGSVSRKIKAVSKEVEEKARLDEELSIARDYQRKNLPSMRASGQGWSWRSWFRPASFLGGDWFDFREITFADGRKLLVVGIADITGHGVAAALFTTIVSSVWSLWCDEMALQNAPPDQDARARLLEAIPLRMHRALMSCRKEGSGTAAFCLIDPDSREMSYLTAGHPALVAATPAGVESLRTMNPALGHGDKAAELSWSAASRVIKADEILFLYSDGLLPPGMNSTAWLGQLRRAQKSESFRPSRLFLQRLRETRRVFRSDKSNEDDITLLALKLI